MIIPIPFKVLNDEIVQSQNRGWDRFSKVVFASLQYLPFYGGAKGQYLEVKKDNRGIVTSEKIISEDKISSDSIIKNSDDNLLSKVLGANLQNLKTLSSSLLKLHNLGRKTGYLGINDKSRFKSELSTLGDTASNTVKLIEEIGDNVDVLFKNNVTKRQFEQNYEDDVGEEGVSIDSPDIDTPQFPSEILSDVTIAEAKPVALAVVGENGLAAARPQATAIVNSGVAIARPIATAVAGIDPSTLGLHLSANHSKTKKGEAKRN